MIVHPHPNEDQKKGKLHLVLGRPAHVVALDGFFVAAGSTRCFHDFIRRNHEAQSLEKDRITTGNDEHDR